MTEEIRPSEFRTVYPGERLQFGNSSGVPIPSDCGHLFGRFKMQAMGRANRDAGRFQSCVHTVHAVIAFDDLAGFGIPLGRAPGTGGHTTLTSHTEAGIDKHDTVLGTLLHGPGGTCGHTPGIFAMKARHEYIRRSGLSMNHFGSHGNNIRRFRSHQNIFIALACDGATKTANTFLLVLVEIVNAHYFPPIIKGVSPKLV